MGEYWLIYPIFHWIVWHIDSSKTCESIRESFDTLKSFIFWNSDVIIFLLYLNISVEYIRRYRKISIISPGLINIRKHFLGGLYSKGIISGGYFVLVSKYQTLKFIVIYSYHCQKGVALVKNHLYFALKPTWNHPNIF